MTPYDVAVIKNSVECARYLKSLGGVTGTDALAKLQTQKATASKSQMSKRSENDIKKPVQKSNNNNKNGELNRFFFFYIFKPSV